MCKYVWWECAPLGVHSNWLTCDSCLKLNPTLLKWDKDKWRITKEDQAESRKIPIRSNGIAEARAYLENTVQLRKRIPGTYRLSRSPWALRGSWGLVLLCVVPFIFIFRPTETRVRFNQLLLVKPNILKALSRLCQRRLNNRHFLEWLTSNDSHITAARRAAWCMMTSPWAEVTARNPDATGFFYFSSDYR